MDTNTTVKQLADLCKKGRIAAIVMFIFSLAAAAGFGISLVMTLSGVTDHPQTDGSGSVMIVSSVGAAARSLASLLKCLLYCAALLICANMFAGIIENQTPFRDITAAALKKTALLVFISAIVPSFLGCVMYLIFTPVPLVSLSMRELVAQSGLTVSLTPLFLSVFLFVMTAVFRYGCLLQQESDETL